MIILAMICTKNNLIQHDNKNKNIYDDRKNHHDAVNNDTDN